MGGKSKEIGWLELVHKEKREKRNWLIRTCVVKSVMHQSKEDCINAHCSVMPTNQVHSWSVILGKHMEIDWCLHIIRSLYTHTHTQTHTNPHTHMHTHSYTDKHTHSLRHTCTHNTHSHTHQGPGIQWGELWTSQKLSHPGVLGRASTVKTLTLTTIQMETMTTLHSYLHWVHPTKG